MRRKKIKKNDIWLSWISQSIEIEVNNNHNVACIAHKHTKATARAKLVYEHPIERVVIFLYLNGYISGNNKTHQPNRINRSKKAIQFLKFFFLLFFFLEKKVNYKLNNPVISTFLCSVWCMQRSHEYGWKYMLFVCLLLK